jgi:hypothetical protein
MAIETTPAEPDLPIVRKPLRPRPFWRLFGWGSTACIALAAAALTSQIEAGNERLQLAVAYAREPAHVVAEIPRAVEPNGETQHLAAQVRDLAADRERLTARIAVLEHSLEDMTGSIKKQNEQLAAVRAAKSPPPTPSAPATIPTLAPLVMPALGEAPAAWSTTATAPKETEPAKPPEPAEAAAESDPTPPVQVAAAPADEPAAEPSTPAKEEFGIDLGGARSIEVLRIHWAALKANYGPLLVGLHPLVTEYPRHPSGITYRLVAGPLPDANGAAQLCARFPTLRTGCHPAKFSGAQLAEH